jgi:hypothetical protein
MPGDYSRKTFDRTKHYSGVLMQQGRVQLDADWNEQLAIHLYRTGTETKDVIGHCGVPIGTGGFQIEPTTDGLDLIIAPGRFYAGGLLCELEPAGVPTTYTTQPHYPNPEFTEPLGLSSSPPGNAQIVLDEGTYLVYLDAWRQEITALDDSRIREVALGGPDTATRLKTVWQVRILSADAAGQSSLTCDTDLDAIFPAPSGKLNARTVISTTEDPCELPPASGYRRLENQLYRIEIHKSGNLSAATFKWSRDNATVETTIELIDGLELTVTDVGKDEVLGFAGGQWVEIVDEESELNRHTLYRQLFKIDAVDPATRRITLTPPATLPTGPNLKLRRWDNTGAQASGDGIPLSSSWIALEGGIEVNFASGSYRAGDFWLIPARTATTEIEWPPFEVPNVSPIPQLPFGLVHHYCQLGILTVTPSGLHVEDCRPEFPPLTQMIQLHYVSGDGQEGRPGQVLPQPLQVGVANGTAPVAAARVRFRRILGTGTLTAPGTSPGPDIIVETDADGIAGCNFQLDTTTSIQRVEATLEDIQTLPVRFNASFREIRVQDEGTTVSARDTLNFIGAGVTATDNATLRRVDITIPGGGGFVETRPTNLLFPFVSSITQQGFDTGIVISNTSLDPFGATGLQPQAGAITFFMYTCSVAGGTVRILTTGPNSPGSGLSNGLLRPGCTYTVLLSELLRAAGVTAPFSGYIIAVCDFAGAYGYAQLFQQQGAQMTSSNGYLAVLLSSNRRQTTPYASSTGIGSGRL